MGRRTAPVGYSGGRDGTFGAWGEQRAAQHLIDLGWQIVERNWRCELGEIDLIASEPDGTLVFVEVKCRAGTGYGTPLEAITYAKLRRLRDLARRYLQSAEEHPPRIRIDGIGVLRTRDGVGINHARGLGL